MHHFSNKPANRALTALALALALTGCGGGGGNTTDTPKPASTEMVASFNRIAEYCGEETRLLIANAPAGYTNRLLYRIQRGAELQEVSNIFSVSGNDASNDLVNELKVGVNDRRGTTTGVLVGTGSATVSAGMGVQMRPTLPSGAIACVKSVSWLDAQPTLPVVPGAASPTPVRTLVWSSRGRVALPISTLGAYPVDGFELVGNFTPASGVAFFSVSKSQVADPSAIQICVLSNQGSTWNCGLPKISDDTNRWTFSVGAAQSGVYLLTSSHPESHL
jgi:hypothetical protein